MANIKISEMTELANINAGDLIEVSEDAGGGNYNTKKFDLGDVADALTKRHTQNTDTSLDLGGTNPITAAELVTIRDTTVPAKADISDVNAANNRKAPAQAIVTTYAASGSTGIQVANDAELNMGTGDFTLVWEGSLPDWTPGADTDLIDKYQDSSNYYRFRINTSDKFQLSAKIGGTLVFNLLTTEVITTADGDSSQVVCAVTRESSTSDGLMSVYVNKVLFGTVTITAAAVTDITSTGSLFISGLSNISRIAAQTQFAAIYNRALTAADVADLYVNGIAEQDKFGSQTPVYESDFSAGVDGWVGENATVTHDTNRIEVDITGPGGRCTQPAAGLVKGKQYTASFSLVAGTYSGLLTLAMYGVATSSSFSSATGDYTISFIARSSGDLAIQRNDQSTGIFYLSAFTVKPVGATWAISAENAQPSPGQIFDITGHGNHALMPATGASLKLYKDTFEIHWTNTWAGTSESQYLSGFNQNILPAGYIRIDSITLTCTATGVNIEIGDGSDADRFVASTALATYLDCTIASRSHDLTNRKMTIKPNAAYTGTITTLVRGTIIE